MARHFLWGQWGGMIWKIDMGKKKNPMDWHKTFHRIMGRHVSPWNDFWRRVSIVIPPGKRNGAHYLCISIMFTCTSKTSVGWSLVSITTDAWRLPNMSSWLTVTPISFLIQFTSSTAIRESTPKSVKGTNSVFFIKFKHFCPPKTKI